MPSTRRVATVRGVFLHDFHDADNGWDFAARVVKESEIPLLHRS